VLPYAIVCGFWVGVEGSVPIASGQARERASKRVGGCNTRGVGGETSREVVFVAVTAAMATLTIVCWRKETVGLLLSVLAQLGWLIGAARTDPPVTESGVKRHINDFFGSSVAKPHTTRRGANSFLL